VSGKIEQLNIRLCIGSWSLWVSV